MAETSKSSIAAIGIIAAGIGFAVVCISLGISVNEVSAETVTASTGYSTGMTEDVLRP